MLCQLKSIDDMKRKNSRINDLLQNRVKILRSAKRKAIFFKNKVFRILIPFNKKTGANNINKNPILLGDIVRVRSQQEIRSILDYYEKYMGCLFIDEMYEHCGKICKVLKTVDYFFDEAKQKMTKCKDIVILEEVQCSGRQRLYRESCDRSCFFFWHKDWLQKID